MTTPPEPATPPTPLAPPTARTSPARARRAPAPVAVPPAPVIDALPIVPSGRSAIPGLDRRRAERLRTGKLPIDARLDLHGLTQDDAHAALASFLTRAIAAEQRCLLIITGKGGRHANAEGGSGVLRRSLPHWLGQAPFQAAILAVRPAASQHGGEGAFYVLLRRRRAP